VSPSPSKERGKKKKEGRKPLLNSLYYGAIMREFEEVATAKTCSSVDSHFSEC